MGQLQERSQSSLCLKTPWSLWRIWRRFTERLSILRPFHLKLRPEFLCEKHQSRPASHEHQTSPTTCQAADGEDQGTQQVAHWSVLASRFGAKRARSAKAGGARQAGFVRIGAAVRRVSQLLLFEGQKRALKVVIDAYV